MAVFSSSTVSIGAPTKKSDYDRVLANTQDNRSRVSSLESGTVAIIHSELQTFNSGTVFNATATFNSSTVFNATATFNNDIYLPDFTAGANVLSNMEHEHVVSDATAYHIIFEFVMPSKGIASFNFDMKSSTTANVYGRIYKNGTPFGTERIRAVATYATYSEDLAFEYGDRLQLYVRSASGGIIPTLINYQIAIGEEFNGLLKGLLYSGIMTPL